MYVLFGPRRVPLEERGVQDVRGHKPGTDAPYKLDVRVRSGLGDYGRVGEEWTGRLRAVRHGGQILAQTFVQETFTLF